MDENMICNKISDDARFKNTFKISFIIVEISINIIAFDIKRILNIFIASN